MLQLEDALSRMLELLPPAQTEEVPLVDAQGRILLRSPVAPIDLPPFSNSAVDGYAVRSIDTTAAAPGASVQLRLAGRVATGSGDAGEVSFGCCARVFTGSILPPGADAVVMQEDVELSPDPAKTILIRSPVDPGEAVRRQGEDVQAGIPLADPGNRIGAGLICLLAASGITRVQAGKRPRIGIVSTGSELREAPAQLERGQIFDSNRSTVAALLRSTHLEPAMSLLVQDNRETVKSALAQVFEECDVAISTGGVSVGETDHIKQAFEELGGEINFWRIAIKPGKPFVFGRVRDRFLLGLPGNPVSVFVTFLLLVRPFLLRWQGATGVSMRCASGKLRETVHNPGPRRHFMCVLLDAAGNVELAGPQGSHRLAPLARANGLLDVPADSDLSAGQDVKVLLWD